MLGINGLSRFEKLGNFTGLKLLSNDMKKYFSQIMGISSIYEKTVNLNKPWSGSIK